MSYRVLFLGRPNVGKSTLINRLVGKRVSIVFDRPGVTRDRKEVELKEGEHNIILVDTGGFIISEDADRLTKLVRTQIERGMNSADLLVFVTDVKQGCTAFDIEIANLLRRRKESVIVVVNKCDNAYEQNLNSQEFHKLGLGELFVVSATTGYGVSQLRDEIIRRSKSLNSDFREETTSVSKSINIAVLGTPNVGKSSFINSLIDDERLIVSEVPGTTVDTVDVKFSYKGYEFVFIDTAGIRRKKKIKDELEEISVRKSIATIERASVVIIMFDANEEISEQTKRILSLTEKRGRGIIFFANKWDLVEKSKKYENEDAFTKEFYYIFKANTYCPLIIDSALKLRSKEEILDLIIKVDENFRRRVKTSELNQLLEQIQIEHPPHGTKGRMIKFFYAAQTEEAPPNFTIFANYPDEIHFAYKRYLINKIRNRFEFEGVPITINFRGR
ncbi:MAG: ribosome biogenesis GTPase Der [Deltaproteobacteria bacterium]|nr:ribosome biogenesis GTPase Der [Deltaproteobacteria bacterium]